MSRVPATLLPHRLRLQPRVGTTGQGAPAYGPGRAGVAALLSLKRTKVVDEGGNRISADATALISAGSDVETEALVTVQRGPMAGKTYTVVAVTIDHLHHEQARLLGLSGPR